MWLIGVLTFGLPWLVAPGTANPFLEMKELLLVGGGWGLILWTLLRSPNLPSRGLRNVWLGWLGCYVLLMGLYHFQWQYLWRAPEQRAFTYNVYTWLPTVHLFMALLLVRVLALHWLRTTLALQVLTQWLCLSVALVSGYAILQSLGLDQWFVAAGYGKGNTWGGVYAGFGNPSYLALYLAAVSPLCFIVRARRYLLYFLLLLLALYCTHVRMAWILLGVGLLSYHLARWWRAWRRLTHWLVIIGLYLMGSYVLWLGWQWAQGDERWQIWQETWKFLPSSMEKTQPAWTGRGLATFQLLMRTTPWMWAHNEWLQSLMELGVIGTGLFLAAIGWATRQAWRQATHSIIDAGWFGVWMVLLTASCFHFPFHLAPIIWIGLCAWAVIERDQGEVSDG